MKGYMQRMGSTVTTMVALLRPVMLMPVRSMEPREASTVESPYTTKRLRNTCSVVLELEVRNTLERKNSFQRATA